MGKLERIIVQRPGSIKGFVDSFFVYASIFLLLATLLLNILWAFRNSDPKDFGSFYTSGRAFISQGNPYSSDLNGVFIVELGDQKISSPNLNPPFSLYFASLLTVLPLQISFHVWQVFSLLLYILCIALLYKTIPCNRLKLLWGLCLAGFWHTIELGQIYIPLLFFMTMAWIFMEKRKYILAGFFIGLLIAIKPNFAIWVLVMGIGGFWKVSLSAVTTAVVVSILPLLTNGLSIYQQWITASSAYNGYAFTGNGSLFGLTSNLGNYNLGYILALVLFILGVYIIIKIKPENKLVHFIGLSLSLLCSPIAWPGYTIFLVPVFFTIRWNIIHKVVAIILSIPVLMMFTAVDQWQSLRVVFSWIYGFAILLLFGVTVHEIMEGNDLTNSNPPSKNISIAENGII